ncbi:MAG: hypothetical protein HY287_04780 [Planctomycetes bacterium]|nr:hypothetical protein [Planctomycetota bacterium]MBI3833628.1 hypothetical protein [Planctomycetota bacterium]
MQNAFSIMLDAFSVMLNGAKHLLSRDSSVAPRDLRMTPFAALMMLASFTGCATPSGSQAAEKKSGVYASNKGQPWTIQCIELPGLTRQRDVRTFAESLKNTQGIRAADVSILDESDGYSRLYYGTYHRTMDKSGKPMLPAQIHADVHMLRQLGGESGEHYFFRALPVPVPQPDVGNRDWNLMNANGMYSLQVAAFEPNEDFWEFKKAAADYCDYLHKKGYDAYYYHTRSSSMVTVGTFGADAVFRGADQKPYYSEAVGRLQSDELLKYNVVNGAVLKARDSQGNWVPVPSRLVRIPTREPTNDFVPRPASILNKG